MISHETIQAIANDVLPHWVWRVQETSQGLCLMATAQFYASVPLNPHVLMDRDQIAVLMTQTDMELEQLIRDHIDNKPAMRVNTNERKGDALR